MYRYFDPVASRRLIMTLALLAAISYAPVPAYAGVDAGKSAYEAGDYEKAQQEFTAPANSSDAEGQYWMGRLLDEG